VCLGGSSYSTYFTPLNGKHFGQHHNYCRIVKEESSSSLVTMAFYGYTQDENWPIESDHRGISKLLRSKHLDMLSAPHTYRRRRLPMAVTRVDVRPARSYNQ